jgi:ABC-type oligopeptide transport system substrate-binding subunit
MLDRSGPRFVKNPNYRDADSLPVEEIWLREFTSAQVTDAFASGELDLIWDDPYDDSFVSLMGNHDLHLYDTTCFQYIGLNLAPSLEDAGVRGPSPVP